MKKLLCPLGGALLVALLALAACGGSDTTTATSPSAAPGEMASPSVAASPSGVPLPTPTVAGTIVFAHVLNSQQGLEDADICVVESDGTGLKTLAGGPAWQEFPSWSPDGTKIVYDGGASPDVRVAQVCVMNADGSEKVELTEGSGYCPDWSPDGKRIVFVRYVGGKRGEDIFVMNADGTGERCLVDMKDGDSRPVWAKTGEIFFLHHEALYSVNPDGSGLARIKQPGDIENFAISADGKMLAYHDDELVAVLPLRSAGRRVALLKPVSDYVLHDPGVVPGWTRDRKALVVAASSGDTIHGSRLYVVSVRGSGLSAVPGIETALDPAWRPQ
ncbi:MAG: hypothetical protein V2J16_11905 [Thermoleophilia bacterium]|jgi:Tol biopolymer transport system component|nr:hypothetical protein [Thermoleophilia bacterium]